MRFLTLIMAGALSASQIAGAEPVVAGFNLQRGGVFAIDTDAGWLSQLRAAIQAEFPAVTFRGVGTLSSSTLTGADVLIISSTFSGGVPISPLSGSEVNALLSFVAEGGSALLFVEADSPAGWDVANESVVNALGMDVTGSVGAGAVVDLTGAVSPINSGRFGTIASVTFTTGGRFDVLGPNAQSAGVYTGTENVGTAFLPKDSLGIGSGLVAVFGDTTFVLDGFLAPAHRIAVLNVLGEALLGECRADFDRSGRVEVPDIFAFLSAWFAGDIEQANYNGDAFLNTTDVFAFLADWFAGCA